MSNIKTCRYCGETKAIELFRHNRNQCLACKSIYQKKWNDAKRKLRPEKVKIILTEKTCNTCGITQKIELFPKKRCVCFDCKRKEQKDWTEKKKAEYVSSPLFITIGNKQKPARKCNRCSEMKEVKFFWGLVQTCMSCKKQSKKEVIERRRIKAELEAQATHKTCIRCKITKEIGKGITRKKNPYCRDCSNEINREKYRRNNGAKKLKIKRHTDIAFNIERKLRSRLRLAIKLDGGEKRHGTEEMLGCSFEEFREHLKSKFTEGMTMEKVLSAEIVLDHKIPCSLFDLENEEEQLKCFHYSNIQPLWKYDNDIKYDKYMGVEWRKVPKAIRKIPKLLNLLEELNRID